MIKDCRYCEIPDRKIEIKDYFDKMILWRKYVDDGIFEFIGGDTSLENFENAISNEEKFVFYHYFQCSCGNFIRSGICIRSSVPILEHIKSLPITLDLQ